jgi:hypothetical protein
MVTADFRCDECCCTQQLAVVPSGVTYWCHACSLCGHLDCGGEFVRVWSAPAVGSGSSGEPFRKGGVS